jgi:hypothetical protein
MPSGCRRSGVRRRDPRTSCRSTSPRRPAGGEEVPVARIECGGVTPLQVLDGDTFLGREDGSLDHDEDPTGVREGSSHVAAPPARHGPRTEAHSRLNILVPVTTSPGTGGALERSPQPGSLAKCHIERLCASPAEASRATEAGLFTQHHRREILKKFEPGLGRWHSACSGMG